MSTYYIDQLKSYNEKYQDAINKIDNINSKINNLYKSFNNALGPDIELIKNDLTSLCSELENVKTKLTNAYNKTNNNAKNSDIVYDKALLEKTNYTPTFGNSNNTYESTHQKDVYIEDGIIYINEKFKQIPKNESFDLLEAIGIKEKKCTYVNTTVYAGVEEMMQGVLKLYGSPKKSNTYEDK